VSGYLKEKGANSRKILSIKDYPEGASDAKKFVHSNYEWALSEMTKKPANTFLVIMQDADKETQYDVLHSFSGLTDRVFVVVPKRNIETWFYFFAHKNDIDAASESDDRKQWYKHNDEKPKPATCGREYVDIVNAKKNGQSIPNIPASLDATTEQIILCEKNC
jgi:hypothetical protein